jgi:hypothetical protein
MTTISKPINNITINNPGATVGGIVNSGSTSTITFTGTGSSGSTYSVGTTGIGLRGGGVYGAGQIYTTTGTGTANWATTSNPYDAVMKINQTSPPTIEVKGNMVINGVDLEERLKTIEKVLLIPERDAILEKKYPKLKKMHDEYIAALGKYRTFEAIKGEDE